MNLYILIRRLRGPAFLLLVGLIALLAQAHILSWGRSWPLYLILAGVLLLAERAALATTGYGQTPYPGSPYGNPPYGSGPYAGANPQQPGQSPANPGTAIVPAHGDEFGNGGNGGQQ